MGVHSCRSQKTPSRSQFSPSTILGPGSNPGRHIGPRIKSRSPGLAAGSFTYWAFSTVLTWLCTLEVYDHWQVPVWLRDSHSHLQLWQQHREEAFRVGLVWTRRQTAWLHRFKSTLVLCPMGPAITSEAAKTIALFKSLEDTHHRHVCSSQNLFFLIL